jgi:hypothetical protein
MIITIGERVTPKWIDHLNQDEVFCFGSNEKGRHGRGAAKTALQWGAKFGQAFGLQGKTFAIPTVNASISNTLSVEKIKTYVNRFIEFAKEHHELIFLVTPIGCGLAGHSPKAIAPLFKECVDLKNVWLPKEFWRVLQHE